MPYPTWQSNQTDINRSDAIIKQLASMFAGQEYAVPIIEPVNE